LVFLDKKEEFVAAVCAIRRTPVGDGGRPGCGIAIGPPTAMSLMQTPSANACVLGAVDEWGEV
jgi:hypothetical protein